MGSQILPCGLYDFISSIAAGLKFLIDTARSRADYAIPFPFVRRTRLEVSWELTVSVFKVHYSVETLRDRAVDYHLWLLYVGVSNNTLKHPIYK